ncbi:MAG TPA: ABC transporter ATP-binding protein [bacterium]|jgi:ABC-type Fe3+/spermidine/putrescine transport system ATPase subunit
MADVRLSHITKQFGATLAVDDVSLEVADGSFTTLLGPSGCGKTTTLRMIAGFYRPDRGEILIGGDRVNDLPPYRRPTAMVFQEYALFPHMTVFENVAYGLRMRGVQASETRRRVGDALDLVGLVGVTDTFPSRLSGGQQQRVALARALVVQPQVLLLDEPLSNLDAKLRVRVRTEIRLLQQRLGITAVYVTHDQEEALAVSDRVAVMNHGRIQQVASPLEIYHRPQNRFVADFVGLANFVEAEAAGEGRVRMGRHLLTVSEPVAGPVTLVLRPEAVLLRSQPPAGASNVLAGHIAAMSFLGTLARYWVDVDGMRWIVDVPSPGADVLSGEVYLEIPPERIHILKAEASAPSSPSPPS